LEFIEQGRVCAGGFPRQRWAVKTDDFHQRFVLRSKPREFDFSTGDL
jgi:hypothetical protein